MASKSKLIARKVPVEVIQRDMVPYREWLKYPEESLSGDCFFTDKVLWGEIWIKDLSKRGTIWRGYVKAGQLYLDETTRVGKTNVTATNSGKVPSLITTGKYKVWLDAFIRMGDFPEIYSSDVLTIDDEFDPQKAQWTATGIPHSKYWPLVVIEIPRKGQPARMEVPSSRFHWLYRLSRLVETLEQLIKIHQFQAAHISNVSELASHISAFMATMSEGTRNLRATRQNIDDYMFIQGTLREISILTLNTINYGYPNESVVRFRKHVNNLAELVWRMIQDPRYQTHVAAADSIMAEEHRILLSRLQEVFSRIPKTCDHVREAPNNLYVVGESFPYGEKYAEEFVKPYINYAAKESGHPPIFEVDKPRGWVKWLDGVRKYALTMINYGSIEFVRKRIPTEKIEKIFEAMSDHLEKRVGLVNLEKSLPFSKLKPRVEHWIKEFEAMAERYAREGCEEAARLARESAKNNRSLFDARLAKERAPIRAQIDEIDAKLKQFEEEVTQLQKEHPTKLTDRLKEGDGRTVYKAVYWFQGIEIALKGVVAAVAWVKFVQTWEKHGKGTESSAYKGADAFFKTSSFMSSLFQFSGLGRLGRATQWYRFLAIAESDAAAKLALAAKLEKFSKLGKGLGAVADVGSASLATYEIFFDDTYGDDLLERYTPGDACGMYAWHLVIWGGKWVTATGSVSGNFTKNPISTKLQAIGYVIQFAGEFGEAVYKIGKSEKAHCMALFAEVRNWNNINMAMMKVDGFEPSNFLLERDYRKVVDAMERFEWRTIDKAALANLLGAPVASD